MRDVYVFIVISLALTNLFAAEDVEIYTWVGSDVRFNLPSFVTCGQYNVTKGMGNNVIVVYNSTHTHISTLYADRSSAELLDNGTMQFTLHSVQRSDVATYLVRPSGYSSRRCWVKYVLRVTRQDTRTTGYWLNWGPWSVCDATCGAGTMIRQRECSIPEYCFSGSTLDAASCQSGHSCITYDWSGWSDWSECSSTCGGGKCSRYRYCMDSNLRRVSIELCRGKVVEQQACYVTACDNDRTPTIQAIVLQWTTWTPWSTCSQSCGQGFRTRDRKCRDIHSIVQIDRCTGSSIENRTCGSSACMRHTGDKTTSGINQTESRDQTVELPLSVVVVAGAGLFILILVTVICVLVVKLRNKKHQLGMHTTVSSKRANTITNQTYRKKSSSISCSSLGVSGVHVYDEIDDAKVNERNSVITIDNPYVMLPKSTSPMDNGQKDIVTYNNTQETVFVFDRKVSNVYLNVSGASKSNLLEVPRHMSIDSVGYLMPGNTMERAAKRNKKYTKNMH